MEGAILSTLNTKGAKQKIYSSSFIKILNKFNIKSYNLDKIAPRTLK